MLKAYLPPVYQTARQTFIMHRGGHLGLALLSFAPLAYLLASINAWRLTGYLGVVVLVAAGLPDWDLRIPLLTHRGSTHTLAFAFVVGIATAVVVDALVASSLTGSLPLLAIEIVGADLGYPLRTAHGLGFVVGVLGVGSHLVGDVLTPAGVPLLWPLSAEKYSLKVVNSANERANQLLELAGLIVVAAVLLLSGAARFG